jgi:uncharacterized membrane protein YbhN (UPF0104 family)
VRGPGHINRSRFALGAVVAVATLSGFALLVRGMGGDVVAAAASPRWGWLVAALCVWAAVQPLRAWAWASTLRCPIGFRSVYAASAVGSFLDTVLPWRLGEASKVAVLRVASGPQWPGLPRAGGSLIGMHLLEGLAFALVGAVATPFLPLPSWTRWTLVACCVVGIAAVAVVARFRLALGPRAIAQAGGILVATWGLRWIGVFLLLHAVGVEVGLGGALLYMLVTGLANVAPLLPGNIGIYQGAAVGALALVGHSGTSAVAASLLAPAVVSAAAAAAALVALALFGRRCVDVSRAALARP